MNGDSEDDLVCSDAYDVIICTVDLRENRNKVTWEKDNALIAERVLP